jgi:type VI secretion system protein ImpK
MPDFDDPFTPAPDATVMRPRPGAGRRGAADAVGATRPAAAPVPPPPPEPFADAVKDVAGAGLNPLVQAASPLLLLAARLRGTLSVPDVSALRRSVLEEIRRFEARARASGVASEVTLAARYALCAALDEAVLSTPWGAHSEWAQQTLLVALHREAWGGEKFFDMLDRISPDPARHIDLMELQYLCIAFGFAGKYQVQDRGHAALAEVQGRLYTAIREARGAPRAELSLRWQGVQDRRNPLVRYVPWWVVAAAALAVLAVAFTIYHARLTEAAAPVTLALSQVGTQRFDTPPAVPAAGPTLASLLADAIARQEVSVEEAGGRTVVTPLAADLFASGRATVSPAHQDLLRQIARAVDRVPGSVLVVGHTDDQQLRSLRFSGNFELSRERARSVVEIMRGAMENPARLEPIGVGSSQPRYEPASAPGNRARNRRVEIVHVRGA